MNSKQISLWDNVALESGYRYMSQLKLAEAIGYFKEAMQLPFCDKAITQDSIDACIFWQPLIEKGQERDTDFVARLLSEYTRFSFTPSMIGLRKAILNYFVEYLSYEPYMNVTAMESAFDLLLKMKDFPAAESMVMKYIDRYPENTCLFYFLAQAQGRNGNKASATENYILALLYQPAETYLPRIENLTLQTLIHSHGPAMAPLYAWIQELVPAISVINNVVTINEEHALAIRSLELLRHAIKAQEDEDRSSLINYRKQLKSENPELYATYFSRLKQRK